MMALESNNGSHRGLQHNSGSLTSNAFQALGAKTTFWTLQPHQQVIAHNFIIRNALKSFINMVQCNTGSDTQQSRRGPGMSTSGCFAGK